MRILASLCVAVLLLGLVSLRVDASELQAALEEEIDPEQGLSTELVDQIGGYDGAVSGFGARCLSLLGATLGRIRELGLTDGLRTLGLILAAALFCAVLEDSGQGKAAVPLVGALTITAACVRPLGSMIALGTKTIREIHTYTGLLMPGMTGLMAASCNRRAKT